MTIYGIKNGVSCKDSFDNIANLESFERELDDIYEYWSYDQSDIEEWLDAAYEADIIEQMRRG